MQLAGSNVGCSVEQVEVQVLHGLDGGQIAFLERIVDQHLMKLLLLFELVLQIHTGSRIAEEEVGHQREVGADYRECCVELDRLIVGPPKLLFACLA